MDSKQKAHELTNKFYQPITLNLNGVGAYNNSKQIWEHATQCAIIAVEEIIAAFNSFFMIPVKELKFWNEVLSHLHNKI